MSPENKKVSMNYKILEIDPWLADHAKDITLRMKLYDDTHTRLGGGGTLSDFANGHLFYGFHHGTDGTVFREWAPNAREIALFGDFNNWDRESHVLTPLGEGNFEITLPGENVLPHGSRVKIAITTWDGRKFDRIPLYCKRVVQDPVTFAFDGQIWNPETPYAWKNADFTRKDEPPLIYEAHVGISSEEEKVADFSHFIKNVLPRIKKLGYNTIQLMAVMEHAYYASFGYQVTNFFAVSSRFGTPEQLKKLIDTAHGMGIAVLLDVVHSHASSNALDGIGQFDGTDSMFFHEGNKGNHPAWGSKLFDYSKDAVRHFLLSNIKFWLTEYNFDGFRFDGVTSMLYHDHGLGGIFDNYKKYFSLNTDVDAVTYLQLASKLCKEINPDSLIIAEDMSGMPGMCLPIEHGGIGFDYRLNMGVPDFWIRTLLGKDEFWDLSQMWHELSQRRPLEKTIGYCESHDQALVGDKTIMFRLADKEMYWFMAKNTPSHIIDRAIALHKMIRLISCACAGEGYLNFMANEFGHPEWIDFPREGNNSSYYYARRQWSLVDNTDLKYEYLNNFDRDMITLVGKNELLSNPAILLRHDSSHKALVFEKGNYIFVFNFHPSSPCKTAILRNVKSKWKVVLNSDWEKYGGSSKEISEIYESESDKSGFVLELPAGKRSAVVYKRTGVLS